MKFDKETFRLSETAGVQKKALIIGVIGFLVSIPIYFVNSGAFFFSYLTAYMFWFTVTMGAFFVVLLGHLTSATWYLVYRRILEVLMTSIPLMAILFIPILIGSHDLYHWSHADLVAHDHLLQKKAGYLNIPFFAIRAAVYFIIWYLLTSRLYKLSLKQDGGSSDEYRLKMKRNSAPGMIVFALTITFASFDWVMSLEPHWFSTIFGLYIFSGAVVTIYSFLVVVSDYLKKKDVLGDHITIEHYHDIGKHLFGFIIFWGYMAFSQYFLIWYANIPEETYWFAMRWEGSWKILTMIIVFGHFVVPFLGTITWKQKRSYKWMTFISIWILAMHFIDLYWLIVPTLNKSGIHFNYLYLTQFIAIGGIYFWYFWNKLSKNATVPIGDNRLEESFTFEA